jgi:hypothetical protein
MSSIQTVPLLLIEGNQVQRVYVNGQRSFALAGLAAAKGTARETLVGIEVQNEVVFWGQTTETKLFGSGHAASLSPGIVHASFTALQKG